MKEKVAPTGPSLGNPMAWETYLPGQIVASSYVIERVLGSGAVGVDLAARHRDLGYLAAVKLLHGEMRTRAGVVRRFVRASNRAARIRCPYAARVLEVGDTSDRGPFVVLEYLEGKTLTEVLASGPPLPVQAAVDYALQACAALASAHASGIVHYAMTPATLLLTGRGEAAALKLLELGTAPAAILRGDSRYAAANLAPAYAAPEQLRSATGIDHRADIWSLGAVLYTCLTKRPPFEGNDAASVRAAVLKSEPAPLPSTVPAPLQAVLERCLRKEPKQRFQNIGELALTLGPFASSQGRVLARRTAAILRAAGWPVAGAPALSSRPPPPVALAATPVAVGADATRHRKRMALVSGLLFAALTFLALDVAFAAVYLVPRLKAQRPAAPVAAVAPTVRSVTLESDPPGARVELDGTTLGQTPLNTVLAPRTYTFRFYLDGYSGESVKLNVDGDGAQPLRARAALTKAQPVVQTPAAPEPVVAAAPGAPAPLAAAPPVAGPHAHKAGAKPAAVAPDPATSARTSARPVTVAAATAEGLPPRVASAAPVVTTAARAAPQPPPPAAGAATSPVPTRVQNEDPWAPPSTKMYDEDPWAPRAK